MMFISTVAAACTLLTLVSGAPSKSIQERASHCGQWDSVQTGPYTVYNDLWGQSAASSGSQCFAVDSLSGSTLKWHTTWTWAGGAGHVKSYPNAVVSVTPTPLSRISSIPSTWNYTSSGASVVADVSYDMFTASSATGAHQYEIMIWLAAIGGAGPISSTYGANGATPVATPTLAGNKWKLFKGPNGSTTVFSFVAEQQITNFKGDLMAFFKYLESSQGMPSSQYLTSIGAGTEPFTGSNAELTVTAYSTVVEYA